MIVQLSENTKKGDGRAAWHALKDWYKGKTTSGDIAKTCRLKLQALEFTPKGDANMYINEFIRFKNQLEDIRRGSTLQH